MEIKKIEKTGKNSFTIACRKDGNPIKFEEWLTNLGKRHLCEKSGAEVCKYCFPPDAISAYEVYPYKCLN